MNDQKFLTFTIEPELNSVLNASNVPTAATIFCYGGRWRYQLREKPLADHDDLENTVNLLINPAAGLDIAMGPFDFQSVDIGIEWFEEGQKSLYKITSINGLSLGLELLQGKRSPIVPLNFPGRAVRDAARIPDDASYCCWLNEVNINQCNAAKSAAANEVAMLLLGGLAYFNRDESGNCKLIQINRFRRIDTGRLMYNEPKRWKSKYTQMLVDQDRFGFSQHTALCEHGVRHLAFLNAGESFVSSNDPNDIWTPTQYWAFLYLFNDDKSPNERDCFYEVSPIALGASPSDAIQQDQR